MLGKPVTSMMPGQHAVTLNHHSPFLKNSSPSLGNVPPRFGAFWKPICHFHRGRVKSGMNFDRFEHRIALPGPLLLLAAASWPAGLHVPVAIVFNAANA
jgi:hypothetical protein